MKKNFIILILILSQNVLMGGVVDSITVQETIDALHKQYTQKQKQAPALNSRIEEGVRQAAELWQKQDGSADEFREFCVRNFIADPAQLDMTFARFEENLETIYGHNHEINLNLSKPTQLDLGPVLPVDYLFAEYDPFAHIQDDFFKTKIAFVILLNFPRYTLEQKLENGPDWSRSEWAMARLADAFDTRVPAEVSQELSRRYVQADDYIANYNIYMHNLLNNKGERPFPEGLKLITHWGLRDELKSHYADKSGLEKQQMIHAVMRHIIMQDIPQTVINSDKADWNPLTNNVYKEGKEQPFQPEPDVRYQYLLNVFHAEQKADPYYSDAPTKMDREFNRRREIPEKQVEALLVSVLTDPVGKQVAGLISKRLGRKLQPFDIWYSGFKQRSSIDEAELDRIVGEKYPSVAAFQKDLPNIFDKLGFDAETGAFLQSKITVDPSRGAGHASGAMRRADNAHLRTRIPETGMNYKGYNIAIHELGHNVEQVFSLNRMDHYMLNGVPNTAFTEAFAFVFQSRDLDILGQSIPDPMAENLKALDLYWSTFEISAVSLVDMRVWNWMYKNPDARPAELKQAVISIARDVWNEYCAPVFGIKDSIILAVYSHMIVYGLYLPDYAIGHLIMFQIEQYLKDKNLGEEMERMCKLGTLTPDAWMNAAVGKPISTEPLLVAAGKAVQVIK
ncbi:hypothetical protein JXQ31_08080 [candidate division KSB1 bacterium]|nr:hypothetical protein [candidate division KSB1 bacterium]